MYVVPEGPPGIKAGESLLYLYGPPVACRYRPNKVLPLRSAFSVHTASASASRNDAAATLCNRATKSMIQLI